MHILLSRLIIFHVNIGTKLRLNLQESLYLCVQRNLCKERPPKLAPIMDDLRDILYALEVECFQHDSDTTHDRNGYSINVVVMCCNTSEFSSDLKNAFVRNYL